MREFLKKYENLILLILYPLTGVFYFASQYFGLTYHLIDIPFDYKIPFLPIFVIPYIIWYLYIPANYLYMFFKHKDYFKKQAIAFTVGIILCCICFVVYPTSLNLRPSVTDGGFLGFCLKTIYANDNPVNAFPSLHCFEAVTIHLTTFTWGPLKNKKPLRALSFILVILICLSTVFVKQHSFIDLISGCLLAVILCVAVNIIFNKRNKSYDNKTL